MMTIKQIQKKIKYIKCPQFMVEIFLGHLQICGAHHVHTDEQCMVQSSIFTALHVMQTRYSEEISVCPSVRLSVTRVHCDKTVERSVQIYIPYERTFILVF